IDDGAGVAVSMEAANLIQKLHLKPKRTIRVIAWMNEENGTAGSKQYAKDHEKFGRTISRRWRRMAAPVIRSA
nr:M20/M25/M40 family metallo-hydrolase [Verrucomicrobiota bacterium]